MEKSTWKYIAVGLLVTLILIIIIVVIVSTLTSGGGTGSDCVNSTDCDSGRVCINSTCVPGCDDDGECNASREICESNKCVIGCRLDTDCPASGAVCINSTCRLGCKSPDDCLGNQVCQNEVCVDKCAIGADCQSGICNVSNQYTGLTAIEKSCQRQYEYSFYQGRDEFYQGQYEYLTYQDNESSNEGTCQIATKCVDVTKCTNQGICDAGWCTPKFVDFGCYLGENINPPPSYILAEGKFPFTNYAELSSYLDNVFQAQIGGFLSYPIYIAISILNGMTYLAYSYTLANSNTSTDNCSAIAGVFLSGKIDTASSTWRIYKYFPSYIYGPGIEVSNPSSTQIVAPTACNQGYYINSFIGCDSKSTSLDNAQGICSDTNVLTPLASSTDTKCTSGSTGSCIMKGLQVTFDSFYIKSIRGICENGSYTPSSIGKPVPSSIKLFCDGDMAVVGYKGKRNSYGATAIELLCGAIR